MKILVLNGSPKGKYSLTRQSSLYLEKVFPSHSFTFLEVASKIRWYKKQFEEVAQAVEQCELLLFSYPVYTFSVPAELSEFIALLKEKNLDLHEKFATQITTSKHFYDCTAHEFIKENCLDIGLKYIRGFSADMDDLLTKKGQEDIKKYFRFLIYSKENNLFERDKRVKTPYTPCEIPFMEEKKEKSGTVALVCDFEKGGKLEKMVDAFCKCADQNVTVYNLREYPLKGGCLGCLKCATDGKCIYTDGFSDFLREKILPADAILYAFTVCNHGMGSLLKMYDDRQFCNGHRTVTEGKPTGYIVEGHLSDEKNLMTVIQARGETGGNYVSGICTDEGHFEEDLTALCKNLTYALQEKLTFPANFYGVGGIKIFRDLVYGMQGIMREDHRFYKKHKIYDFPQKKKGNMIKMYLVGALMKLLKNPKVAKKADPKMISEGMLLPYKKLLAKANPEEK